MTVFLTLFYEFFRIGLFAFGGGLATIPFLFELTRRYDWFSAVELADMIAISEATPGPIGINMATYCGFRTTGLPGSMVATFALVLPSFVVLYIVSKFMYLTKKRIVNDALYGLRVVVVVLIISALWSIFSITFIHDTVRWKEIALFLATFALSLSFKKIPPTFFVFACGIIGLVLF